MALAASIRATGDLATLAGCDALLVVAPAQHLRAVLGALPAGERPLVLCAKGIEDSTGLLMHEVAREVQPAAPLAILSGPTFAHEVAAGLPTAVTLAVADRALGEQLVARIARPFFRPYLSDDLAGRGSRRRGQERARYRLWRGRGQRARVERPGGADLARLRRNGPLRPRQGRTDGNAGRARRIGRSRPHLLVGEFAQFQPRQGHWRGRASADLLADRRTVAEGAFTAPVLKRVADGLGVDMPIVAAVCALLAEEASVDDVVGRLLARPLRAEGV